MKIFVICWCLSVSALLVSTHALPSRRWGMRARPHLYRNDAEQTSIDRDRSRLLWSRLLWIRGGSSNAQIRASKAVRGSSSNSNNNVQKTVPGVESVAAAEQAQHVRNLWLVKILFLLFYGSLGSLMPYLPVYYHSLGIPGRQIGQLGAITPAVTFIVAPLWGALADSTGRHKDVMMFTFITSVLSRLLFVWKTSFEWLSFLVFMTAVLNAPVRPLLDSAALGMLTDKKEYGKQRLWGQFGFGLAGFIVGPLLMSTKFGYHSAFFAHVLISLPTLFIMRRFSPKKQAKESPKFRDGIRLLIHNRDAIVFFSLVFVIGLSSGIIENFAYVRLRECGGEGTVMGVSRFVSSVTGVPMFWFSGHVTKRLSVMGVLIISLCSYVMRFFIYASITDNPWHGLPAEALRGCTFAAMWAASTYYTHRISPPGLTATMLGFLNGIYGGLGQSAGALIGGSLQAKYGTAKTFVIAGMGDIIILSLFVIYWALHPRATVLHES